MSAVVIFPAAKEAEARAYADWTDHNNPWPNNGTPGSFSYAGQIRPDINGDHVAAYLGPPLQYNYAVVEEPEGGEAMRADGVIHPFAVWPEEEG